jgi:charged multivesicular body protein 5
MATENLRNTMVTVDAMKTANKEIKRQYGKIDIDKIEAMHDDMTELLEQANEIQESLGRSYAVPDEIDEADLEAGAAQSRPLRHIGCYNSLRSVELEALSSDLLDEEPSLYLAEVTAPDFIDEAPIENAKEAAKAQVQGS